MASVGPRARTSRLVTRDLGDELLVYDLDRHKAYCLNQVAMEVFRHCDGETTISDMALRIGNVLGVPVDEQRRVGNKVREMRILTAAVGRSVGLATERQQAMIAAAVTGKRVRSTTA